MFGLVLITISYNIIDSSNFPIFYKAFPILYKQSKTFKKISIIKEAFIFDCFVKQINSLINISYFI